MNRLYHGSSQEGLKTIVPRVSTHGKSYVYATEHRLVALLFLSRWNDFLLTLGDAFFGGALHLTLTERYEDAFQDIYGGKTGFLYTLDPGGFHADVDCWELELVSENEQAVISCERIDDIWAELLRCEARGLITLRRYPSRPLSIPADDSDMVEKAVSLYRLSSNAHNGVYCIERFPHLKARVCERFLTLFGIDLEKELP